MFYIENILAKYNAVVAGDSEFSNKLILPATPTNFKEYKKIICQSQFALNQLKKYGEPTRVFEHPDMGLGLLPTWKSDCVLIDYLDLSQVDYTKTKALKQYRVAYFMYFSAFDVFSLFREKETQIKIAKQLLGGRLLREATFPNCLKTGLFVEVENDKGKLEVQELAIKIFDAKGYTPAGAKGLVGTLDAWGVPFSNKNWKKYFDITNFNRDYADTVNMVNVADDGQPPHYMSKHDVTVAYAEGDGLEEIFMLYENIHNAVQNTSDTLKLNWKVKNFQTIGKASNEIGIGAVSKGLAMKSDEKSQYKLTQYLYVSGGYALLDGYHHTVNQVLNVDGGYCKNLKPCQPVIKDLTLDMDLQGAYVGAMRSLPFAVGVPCVYAFPKDRDFRPNFFKEYSNLSKKDMLYPGAWVARVTTTKKLTFKQDLIFSKVFGSTDFEKAQIDDGEGFFVFDESHIDDLNDKKILAQIPDGTFQLLNNEIISGIMTHDYMQVIKNYWTKAEQKELWECLRIDSFIFYNKKYLVDVETFKVEFEKLDDEIHHSFENGCATYQDKRKSVWTIVPTDEGWFGSLQTIRDKTKADAAKAKKAGNTAEANSLKAIQNGMKNINNSSYGVSGSVFYQTEKPTITIKKDGTESIYAVPKMGNVVFAQNTTARVRVGAWCMAKGLNGYPVVTDGTPFNINEVWSWNWKGIDRTLFGSDYLWKLSRYNSAAKVEPKAQFKVKLAPLGGGEKWVVTNLNAKTELVTVSNGELTFEGKEEVWDGLDDIAYEHVKNLFGELDIFKNDVMKYKSKDLYKGAAFQSQANYCFDRFFESRDKDLLGNANVFSIKARGYNLSKLAFHLPDLTDDGVIHPYTKMLIDIYKNDIADVYITTVFSPELLGVADFNKSDNVTEDYISRGFLPHAPTFRSSKPSPFSLSMFRWNTRKQFEEWNKKADNWKSETGFGIELMFLDAQMVENKTPLKYSETVEKIQNIIDSNVCPDSYDERMRVKLDTIVHPQLEIEETHKVKKS